MIVFTRACAITSNSLAVAATEEDGDTFEPDSYYLVYDHLQEDWVTNEHMPIHIQSMIMRYNHNSDHPGGYLIILSSEGDVYHRKDGRIIHEIIPESGISREDSKNYGRLTKIRQIGENLYACGAGGQIYVHSDINKWKHLTQNLLSSPEKEISHIKSAPDTADPRFLDWLQDTINNPPSREIIINDVKGFNSKEIYLCGEEDTRPFLGYWDGSDIREMEPPITEGALTGIYLENKRNIWICGREGLLLLGNVNDGWKKLELSTQLNLFHEITPYRDRLVLVSSVRPGGLYELNSENMEFKKFAPSPPLSRDETLFFAQAIDDVLWVVGMKNIFRYDGVEWEKIIPPKF